MGVVPPQILYRVIFEYFLVLRCKFKQVQGNPREMVDQFFLKFLGGPQNLCIINQKCQISE